MNNIFENAYFGKPYKTRDGRKAIYAGVLPSTTLHRLLIEGTTDTFNYNEFGEFKPYGGSVFDIVSEWQEEINEVKLDKLASAEVNIMNVESSGIGVANDHFPSWVIDFAEEAFKSGYRKALDGKL